MPTFLPAIIAALAVHLAAAETTVIYVNHAASGDNDGTSWADAFVDLHAALATAADMGGENVEIWVAAGTYVPGEPNVPDSSFQLVSGAALYGGFAGWESAIDERDWQSNETFLAGFGFPIVTRVMLGQNLAAGSILDGFTIRDGSTHYLGVFEGAGLYLADSTLHIANCTFESNFASISGGAIYAVRSALTVENCNFASNFAEDGGAITGSATHLTLTDSLFSDNWTTGTGFGGAVWLNGTWLVATNCEFSNNFAGQGGAIRAAPSSTLEVIASGFYGNEAEFSGAAIDKDHLSTLHVTDSIFEGHKGAGHVVETGPIVVENSVFRDNSCGAVRVTGGGSFVNTHFLNNNAFFQQISGGAIWGSGGLEIDNCTFINNSSHFWGGAIAGSGVIRDSYFDGNHTATDAGTIVAQAGFLTLINCEVTGSWNHPDFQYGGAVVHLGNNGHLTLINTLVANNLRQGVRLGSFLGPATATIINSTIAHNDWLPMYVRAGSHADVFNSIIWDDNGFGTCEGACGVWGGGCWCDDSCCGFNDCCPDKFSVCGGCEPEIGTVSVRHSIIKGLPPHDIGGDPLFVDPANGDFRLQPGSPAIDSGNGDYVPDGIETDLDGNPRIVDGSGDGEAIVDMGPYEFQPDTPSKPGDLNGDGVVDVEDLLILLAAWGPCADCPPLPGTCPADLNGDCAVGVPDLLILLANWTV